MRSLLKNLLLIGVAIAITLGLVEVGLRSAGHLVLSGGESLTIGKITQAESPYGYGLAPGATQVSAVGGAYSTRVRINSIGLRDREHAEARDPARERILILGDSFMFGTGVTLDESMARQLAGLLTNVEVINTGTPGYDTGMEFLYYKTRGRLFGANLVLLGFFVNDIAPYKDLDVAYGPDGVPASYTRKTNLMQSGLEPRTGLVGRVTSWFGSNSLLYVFTWQRLHRQAAVRRGAAKSLDDPLFLPFRVDPDPTVAEQWAHTLRTLDELRALTEKQGARLAIVLIPAAPYQMSVDAWREWLDRWKLPADSLSRMNPQQKIEAWCQSSGTPCLDLIEDFRASKNQRLYFDFDLHWNAAGNRLAAQSVAAFLKSNHLVGPVAHP